MTHHNSLSLSLINTTVWLFEGFFGGVGMVVSTRVMRYAPKGEEEEEEVG
jgi:hypothetical protein